MRAMLFYSHSGIRYLVLLAGVITVAWLTQATVRREPFSRASRTLMAIFTGVLDLQVLLGLLLLTVIPFYGALAGHLVLMLAAALVAHAVSIANRNRPPERQSNALLLAGAVGTLVLIVLGILAIGRPIFGSGSLTS